MIWFVLVLLMALIVYIRGSRRKIRDVSFNAMQIIILGGITTAFFNYMIANIVVSRSTEKINTYELRAIRTGDQISGNFFLGSGSIDGKPVYRFFYIARDGKIWLDQVYAYQAAIREEDTRPIVDVWEIKRVRRLSVFWTVLPPMRDTKYYWEFHIPPGSVFQGYELKP